MSNIFLKMVAKPAPSLPDAATSVLQRVYDDVIVPIKAGKFPNKQRLSRLGINCSMYEFGACDGTRRDLNLLFTSNERLRKTPKILADNITNDLYRQLAQGDVAGARVVHVSTVLDPASIESMADRYGVSAQEIRQEVRMLVRETRPDGSAGNVYLVSINFWNCKAVVGEEDLNRVRLNLLSASESFVANLGYKSYEQLIEVVGNRQVRPGRVVKLAVSRALRALFYLDKATDLSDFKQKHIFPQRMDEIDHYLDYRAFTLIELQTIMWKLFGARIPHDVIQRCIEDLNHKKELIAKGPPSPIVYVPARIQEDPQSFDRALTRYGAIRQLFANSLTQLATGELALLALATIGLGPTLLQNAVHFIVGPGAGNH